VHLHLKILTTRTTEIELILQKWWNTQAAGARVKIEQAFGMLKERWRALQDLEVRMADSWVEHALVWNIVKAAMVLHNLYIDTIDYYKPSAGWVPEEDHADELEDVLDDDKVDSKPYQVADPKYQRREDVAWFTGYYKLPRSELKRLWPAGPPPGAKRELDMNS
jgi:hypothetical protein